MITLKIRKYIPTSIPTGIASTRTNKTITITSIIINKAIKYSNTIIITPRLIITQSYRNHDKYNFASSTKYTESDFPNFTLNRLSSLDTVFIFDFNSSGSAFASS